MTQAEADGLLFQLLFSPEGRQDPYPIYRRIREIAPVHRSGFGPLVLSRYDDCMRALRDHHLGKGEGQGFRGRFGVPGAEAEVTATPDDTELQGFMERRRRSMLFLDPPDHTRLRRLVSRAFTPNRVEALRPEITRMVDEILDVIAEEGEVDVMTILAFPLPVTVIGELLGVPAEDRPGFQPLVRKATAALEPNAGLDALRGAADAADEMGEYFLDQIARRRQKPTDDLLTALVQARDEDDALSEEEVVATAQLIFAAGFETTTNLIGNGLLALLQHPDELQRLRDESSLVKTAVEEILRWDSPVQLNGRMVLEDVEIAGETLEPGSFVITLLGGANRDPERFEEPETFDVGREDNNPISFGSGIHHCLGAHLARLEGQVVFGRLVERFPKIELLVDQPEYRPSLTLRGLAELPVRVTA